MCRSRPRYRSARARRSPSRSRAGRPRASARRRSVWSSYHAMKSPTSAAAAGADRVDRVIVVGGEHPLRCLASRRSRRVPTCQSPSWRGKSAKGSRSTATAFGSGTEHQQRRPPTTRNAAAISARDGSTRRSRIDCCAEPRGVEVERLGETHLLAVEEQHQPRQQEQDQHAGDEDHPALEEVGEPLDPLDPVDVDDEARERDPHRVHQHRDRRRREQQHRLVPHRPAVEHREDVGERQDREQVAQPRAGLGHVQLVDPEVDDVALEKDRHV